MNVLGLFSPLVCGALIAFLLIRPRLSICGLGEWVLVLTCGCALGLGLAGTVTFIMLLLNLKFTGWYFACEALCLIGAAVAFARTPWARQPGTRPPAQAGEYPRLWRATHLLLLSVLILACVKAGHSFLVAVEQTPHGAWDAWAIWNLKARFILAGGAEWRTIADSREFVPHPDYPLFLPSAIARYWAALGQTSTAVPALFAAFFMFGTVALLAASLGALGSPAHGLLAGLLLIGAGGYVDNGPCLYADIPLAFCFLGALASLCLHDQSAPGDKRYLLLSGAFAALAAWTKNEGLLFFCILTALYYAACLVRQRALWNEALFLILGAAPFLAAVLIFKIFLVPGAPGNDILQAGTEPWSQKLLDCGRYRQVFAALASQIHSLQANWGGNGFYFLILYAVLVGVRVKARRVGTWISAATLCAMLAAYFMAYVVTNKDLVWHLCGSAGRLVLHLIPSAIFVFFNLVEPPERASLPANTSL